MTTSFGSERMRSIQQFPYKQHPTTGTISGKNLSPDQGGNGTQSNTTFKAMMGNVNKNNNTYQKSGSEESVAKKTSYEVPTYTTSSQVRDTFLDVANDRYGDDDFTSEQIREIAYYNQLRYDLEQEINKLAAEEQGSSNGLTNDEIQSKLVPLQSQKYAIQDFLQDKYNLNGTNNNYRFGLDRDSLGFNESGASPTNEQFQARKQLVERGMDNQTASDIAYGMNGETAHVFKSGALVDTGVSNMENVYRHTGNQSYFNDPRNAGETFNWMNYIDPSALKGQLKTDGSTLDYYYATNFIRENELGTIQPGAKNLFDWRNHSHDELLKKYSNGI
jgi:hypothetical protein